MTSFVFCYVNAYQIYLFRCVVRLWFSQFKGKFYIFPILGLLAVKKNMLLSISVITQ